MKRLSYLIISIVMILSYNVCFASETQSPLISKDINGNGIVNSSDLQRLYTHLNGTYPITDENVLKIADVNQNGEINSLDLQSLYMFLKTSGDSSSNENEDNTQTTFNLVFDTETSTIDLGEDWQKYRYKYIDDEYIYTPSQRFLTKNGHLSDSIYRDSICVMLADDLSKSQIIKTPDVFENVYYKKETKCIELGDDWNKYEYISIPSSTLYNNFNAIYTPNYRKSIDDYGVDLKEPTKNVLIEAESGDNTFNEMYVLIALKANHEAYMRISVPSINLIRYDKETASVDLGVEWKNYKFIYGGPRIAPYTPSQRVLYRNDHYYYDLSSTSTTFGGNSIRIMMSGDENQSVEIETPSVFEGITYNEEEETIDLGENWEKYLFSYSTSLEIPSYVAGDYIPTQRVLKKYGDILEESEIGLYKKLYVYIRLKTTGRVYKIILLREREVTEIPEITYDEETATIDLGKYWRKYRYSYSDISGEFGTIYEPQTQVIKRNENYITNNGSLFKGRYVHIMLKLDDSISRTIEIPEIFADVEYDEETQTLDLGTDWEKYNYTYSDRSLDSFSIEEIGELHTPTQKTLTKVSEITDENLSKAFAAKYVYVGLKADPTQYKRICTPGFVVDSFVYDAESASIDLGDDWKKLKYSNHRSELGFYGAIYTPSQRFLTRSDYAVAGNGYSFEEDYVYIFENYDSDDYAKIATPSPFTNVKYDTETKVVDLGEDFDKYYYTFNNRGNYNTEDFKFEDFHEPSQRYLTKVDMYEVADETEFSGSYVYIILKNNIKSFKRIYTPSDIPELVFDMETGTVDLGPNYKEFWYSFKNVSGEFPTSWHGVSKRKLTYIDATKSYGGNQINGKYLYVATEDLETDYKVIEIPDLFEKVTFDTETQTLDLGDDWKKYVYDCSDSAKYQPHKCFEPTSRIITKYVDGGERQNTFEGKYLYIMLEANEKSYKLIETTIEE